MDRGIVGSRTNDERAVWEACVAHTKAALRIPDARAVTKQGGEHAHGRLASWLERVAETSTPRRRRLALARRAGRRRELLGSSDGAARPPGVHAERVRHRPRGDVVETLRLIGAPAFELLADEA